jgi:hypothetical protein
MVPPAHKAATIFCRGLHNFMRRILLLATTLLLPGCAGSGFYSYLGDTFTPPFGANPNKAPGSGENYRNVVAKTPPSDEPPPILYEAGDVWPAPPKPPPTLKDLQVQQTNEQKGGGYAPLQPLPTLPGYEAPAQQQPAPYVPGSAIPRTGIPHSVGGPVGTGGAGGLNTMGPAGNGTIVVPNGNGTSTVISPNGAVTTIPTPGK